MAGSKNKIDGTITTAAATTAYTMPRDGVFKASLTLNSGSATCTLETRVSDGDWVDAVDANGTAISLAMSTSAEHLAIELLANAGEQFRIQPSSISSPDIDYLYGRCGGV